MTSLFLPYPLLKNFEFWLFIYDPFISSNLLFPRPTIHFVPLLLKSF